MPTVSANNCEMYYEVIAIPASEPGSPTTQACQVGSSSALWGRLPGNDRPDSPA